MCRYGSVLVNSLAGAHGHIAVQLGDDLHGGVHAQHGNAGIHGDDVAVGHDGSHGAAAALIDLAQLAHLPDDTGAVQDGADVGHGLGGGIGAAALALGAGVLEDGDTLVHEGVVPSVGGLGEVGIKGIAHVGAQAEAVLEAAVEAGLGAVAQIVDEGLEGERMHAADAHGADLLLVRQQADGGVLRGVQGQQGHDLVVDADTVVMAVGGQHAPVETHLAALHGGDDGKLGGEEVLLDDAVLLVQQLHDVQLHKLAALTLQGLGAHEDVQLLAGDERTCGLLHLIRGQMGQQIGDHQDGIAVILTDGDGDGGAVLAADHAVERQGHSDPLVLLDASVVMGLQEGQAGILVEGIGLDVDAGGVGVGNADAGALVHALGADNGHHQSLVPVVAVDLVAGLQLHAGDELHEAMFFQLLDGPGDGFPLGLAGIDKRGVAPGVGFHLLPLGGGEVGKAVFGGGQQGFLQFFSIHIKALLCFRVPVPL